MVGQLHRYLHAHAHARTRTHTKSILSISPFPLARHHSLTFYHHIVCIFPCSSLLPYPNCPCTTGCHPNIIFAAAASLKVTRRIYLEWEKKGEKVEYEIKHVIQKTYQQVSAAQHTKMCPPQRRLHRQHQQINASIVYNDYWVQSLLSFKSRGLNGMNVERWPLNPLKRNSNLATA